MKTAVPIILLLLSFIGYTQEMDSIFNRVFNPTIKTVQLFPRLSTRQNEIHPPALNLKQQTHLELHFDDLAEETGYYNLKIIHCNRDWKPSQLVSTDYLNEYNEFQIEDINVSFNTQTQYAHFQFNVPRVTRSGNYGIIVYDQDTEEIILMRRFIIFEERLQVQLNANYTSLRSSKGLQSFEYKLNFMGVNYDTPSEAINVVMKQNGRWDNAKYDVAPFTINEAGGYMNYVFFNAKDQFAGGNEYRMFDARSTNFRGMGIATIDATLLPHEIYLYPTKSRNYHNYQDQNDINGNYVIDHYEDGDGNIRSDYTYVHFTFQYPVPHQSIFVFGAVTDWRLQKGFKMKYNTSSKRYEGKVLMKQGYYNYKYVIGSKDEQRLEGSFSQTENQYEIIVYYRPFGQREDQIIGYKSFQLNFR